MLDFKNSTLDWGAYGTTREEAYEQLFGWAADLPEQLSKNPASAKEQWLWQPNAPTTRAHGCLNFFALNQNFRVVEQAHKNVHLITLIYNRDRAPLLDDMNSKDSDIQFELLISNNHGRTNAVNMNNVSVSARLQQNGIAKHIVRSAATLATILGREQVICYPADMGNFVWLRLDGEPACVDHLVGRDFQRVARKTLKTITSVPPDMQNTKLEAYLHELLAADCTPQSLMSVAQSNLSFNNRLIGKILLPEVNLLDDVTIFHLHHPVLRKKWRKKSVADMDAIEAKWKKPHRSAPKSTVTQVFISTAA